MRALYCSALVCALALGVLLAPIPGFAQHNNNLLPEVTGCNGGPIGIDHRWTYDDSGIWNRGVQEALEYGAIAATVGGAVWLGGEDRLGKTFWQAADSSVAGAAISTTLKYAMGRPRPSQINDPCLWHQGSKYQSFPSGEVTLITAVVTPFILEYHEDSPWVYALYLLPVYDGIARMKVQAHWQTDVLAGFAIGTATGFLARIPDNPVILSVLPHAFMVGLRKQF